MPDPEVPPDPDGDVPPQPSELPEGRPDQDIPELPQRGDPLGDDVRDGPEGLDIGPE